MQSGFMSDTFGFCMLMLLLLEMDESFSHQLSPRVSLICSKLGFMQVVFRSVVFHATYVTEEFASGHGRHVDPAEDDLLA